MLDPKSANPSALPEAPATAVGTAWVRGAEAWLNAQSEILASLETLTQDWLQRRREGIAAASQALEHMSECRDPMEIFRIQQEWFTGAVQRASADASAFNSGFASITRATTSDFEAATRAATSDFEAATRAATSDLEAATRAATSDLEAAARAPAEPMRGAQEEMLKAAGNKPAPRRSGAG
jgi:Phasin protein